MSRFLIILVAAVGLAAARTPASAAGQTDPASDGNAASQCPPKVEAGVRAALGLSVGASSAAGSPIQCRLVHGPTTLTERGVASAGKVETVWATVALRDGRVAQLEVSPDGVVASVGYAHSDLSGSSGAGMAIMFWVFAIVSVAGAVFVITRRNLIAAVMGMVGSFLGIAAIYMMLYAQFLAVVQMLVYAGAIMVLFVFVVMILNRPEDEPVAPSGRAGQALGALAILYLVIRLILLLADVEPPNPEVAMAAPPAAEQCVDWREHTCVATAPYDWGSVRSVGSDLFGPGLFPFEAISILLLLAVVGAIAIARPLHEDDDAPAKTRAEGAA
jgi:NADH-quinone oxidoreductase subunit J